nr:DUF1801 domain-containing protein [Pedobacter sp. ASV2]
MLAAKPKNFEEYVFQFPIETQVILDQVRTAIKKAAPNAEEVISYGMPAFKQNGILVYFAAYKKHIGFYPMPASLIAFKEELSNYKSSKGAVQFPIDKPMPLALIAKIVKFRMKEDLTKEAKRVNNL